MGRSIGHMLVVAQRRFRRTRSGVALILTIALLTLIAIIAAAYISTARIDRYTAHQHTGNTQIDLLVQGVVNMSQSVVLADLFDPLNVYRPVATVATRYEAWDAPIDPTASASNDIKNDRWLADRIPDVRNQAALATTTGGNPNLPVWRAITGSMLYGGKFEDPRDLTSYTTRLDMGVTSVSVNGTNFPALRPIVGGNLASQTYMAADADGDGIADSGLFRIPVGNLNGITYYAAVRIVDNAAAVNVNTALSRTADFDGLGNALPDSPSNPLKPSYFPANVGLAEMLNPSDSRADLAHLGAETKALFDYRTNSIVPAGVVGNTTNADPIDDTGTARTDVRFNSIADALHMQLGRRLANPGRNIASTFYQSLGSLDSMALAYHFCMANPDASPSPLETMLKNASGSADRVYELAPNYATNYRKYDANQADLWFNYSFSDPNTVSGDDGHARPVRSVLTTISTSSNAANYLTRPAVADDTGEFHVMPAYGTTVCRTSLNTASTDLLWRTFYNVMAASTSTAPTGPGNATLPLYKDNLRDPGTSPSQMTSLDMLLLRAGQAAINAAAMRDPGLDVQAFTQKLDLPGIHVPGNKDKIGRVYSYEAQPFLVAVFASTARHPTTAPGYFAIELYNPYDVPFPMKNWTIASMLRGRTEFNGADPVNQFTFASSSTVTIPAGGYLVLENYNDGGSYTNESTGGQTNATALTSRPQALDTSAFKAGTDTVYAPNLANLSGKEMIILRPRRIDGTMLDNSDPQYETYDDRDFMFRVPVDQFDFTSMPAANANASQDFLYVRPNGPGKVWQFVYPGMYPRASDYSWPRQEGTLISPTYNSTVAASAPWLAGQGARPAALFFGGSSASGAGNDGTLVKVFTVPLGPPVDLSVSLNNQPLPLPSRPLANPVISPPARFPYGGFPTPANAMWVPYVGASWSAVRQNNGNGNFNLAGILTYNSVSMDVASAIDTTAATGTVQFPSFVDKADRTSTTNYWATDFLDQFSAINNPDDDYLPNRAVALWATSTAYVVGDRVQYTDSGGTTYARVCKTAHTSGSNANPAASYWTGNWNSFSWNSIAIANKSGITPNKGNEDSASIQGLININTAPWQVLSTLPMVADPIQNAALAKAIVADRSVNGPFQNLFDLNRVLTGQTNNFKNAWNNYPAASLDVPTRMVERLSNLLTVRSDSYTVYILVQGYTGAGTGAPVLTTQRRAAYIVDRSGVTATNKWMNISPLLTD